MDLAGSVEGAGEGQVVVGGGAELVGLPGEAAEGVVVLVAEVGGVGVVFEGALNAIGGDGVALRGIKSSATHKKNHENLD